jgi:hypothetical protein
MAVNAVITADIVNSTLLPPRMEKKLVEEITAVLADNKFEFYRGDSFQALIKDPAEALTLVLRSRTAARKISPIHDVRASIGIGNVQGGIRKLNMATDEAFVFSGRAFDTLAASDRKLVIFSKNKVANHGLQAISLFIDFLFRKLTEKQAEVLFVLLSDKTQLEVAKRLRKSQSTINKHAQAAGWHEIVQILDEYEELVAKI